MTAFDWRRIRGRQLAHAWKILDKGRRQGPVCKENAPTVMLQLQEAAGALISSADRNRCSGCTEKIRACGNSATEVFAEDYESE